MSGGVDSSVAAMLTMQKDYDLHGYTMRVFPEAPTQDAEDAKKTAERLGFGHTTVDLTDCFRQTVMKYFADSYIKGETPNPCVYCNRVIKFGLLFDEMKKDGCQRIVTGHYAKITKDNGRALLQKADYAEKDQSYVLWQLTQEQLSAAQFPLGVFSKTQVRELALDNGFASSDKPDSQDICFIPDGDYAGFIERLTGRKFAHGDFVGTDGKLWGRHNGLICYTVGQRKGLGISAPSPLFVIRKSAEKNKIYLGSNDELFSKRLVATNINLIAADDISSSIRVTAKTRYSQREAAATVFQTESDTLTVEFDEPQRAITPGQSVVLYDGETVVGGGIIT